MRHCSVSRGKCDDNEENATDGQRIICVIRPPTSILPLFCKEKNDATNLFRPFKSPVPLHYNSNTCPNPTKTLGVRVNPVSAIRTYGVQNLSADTILNGSSNCDESSITPLVLWTSVDKNEAQNGICEKDQSHCITVDPILACHLREHQRSGVQFLFNCLMGITIIPGNLCFSNTDTPLTGCILADDMGLGKTLQCITILWTLLHQGFDRKPAVRKALIVCPASLTSNWGNEIDKWLTRKCQYTIVAGTSKAQVISTYRCFQYDFQSRVLITSYESLRLYSDHLQNSTIDLVICDEAHRLKNERAKIVSTICKLPTSRRLLLSGTPVQNCLDELFTLSSVCLPSCIFGDASLFRKQFVNPILAGQSDKASSVVKRKSEEQLCRLSSLSSIYILRRTNELLQKHLPSKTTFAVFCRLSDVQGKKYQEVAENLSRTQHTTSDASPITPQILTGIQTLMKICNHPTLAEEKTTTPDYLQRQYKASRKPLDTSTSGKLLFLVNLVLSIRRETWGTEQCGDRLVIISNFTQTLNLIEQLLKQLSLPFLRLDGHTPVKHRHELIKMFNSPNNPNFAFLLSSKAGGCGINLIGANRLVMLDPDWNPAYDKQALARIWREGQTKECFIYRLFATGTIDERILQRQLNKDALAGVVVMSEKATSDKYLDGSSDNLNLIFHHTTANLFLYNSETPCETFDKLSALLNSRSEKDVSQVEANESDLLTWAHHKDHVTLRDYILQKTVVETFFFDTHLPVVSFVMSFHVGEE